MNKNKTIIIKINDKNKNDAIVDINFENALSKAFFGMPVVRFFQSHCKIKAYRSAFLSVFLLHPRFKTCTRTTRFFTVKRRHVMVRHFDLDG